MRSRKKFKQEKSMSRYRISLSVFLFAAFVAIASCGKRKKETSFDFPQKSTQQLVDRLDQLSTLDWDFLSAKTQVKVSGSQANENFKASIRMKKDSAVLINITKLGVPAMQVLLSNDSLKLVNRIAKCYIKEGRAALPEMIDFPVEYTHLQDLLIGKPLIFNRDFEHIQIQDKNAYVIKTKRPRPGAQAGENLSDVFITYYLDPVTLELSKVVLESPADNARVEISYTGKHEKIEGLMLPLQVDIVIKTPSDEVRVEIVYNRPDVAHEKKLNLNVPENYEKCSK
jgi:hypothetical protein